MRDQRFLRHENSKPAQVPSMAQTFRSTRPSGRITSRSTSSVRSVFTPEAFLGQAIHRLPVPFGGMMRRASPSSVRRDVTNQIVRSRGAEIRAPTCLALKYVIAAD